MSSNEFDEVPEFDFQLSSFNTNLADRFYAAQDGAIKVLLQQSLVSYSSVDNTIFIRFPDQNSVEASMLIKAYKRGKAIVTPIELDTASIKIEVQGYSEVIRRSVNTNQVDVLANSTLVNALDALKAIVKVEELEQKGIAAAITFFTDVRTHGMSIYMNSAIEAFTGYTREALYQDDSVKLFLKSEAIRSLNELQNELRAKGSVTDFELTSERTNGEYGCYTIDAWLVDWNGFPARLTAYKSFSPAPSPLH